MTELKMPEMTKQELKELEEAVEALQKEPIKGFRRFARSIIRPLRKRDRTEACYLAFKHIFDRAGMKFTRKDAQKVRANMLRLSEKLYEVHKAQVDEIDQELERADE
jgi:hypothetical protein